MLIKVYDSEDKLIVQFDGKVRLEQEELQGKFPVLLAKTCIIKTEDGFILNSLQKKETT